MKPVLRHIFTFSCMVAAVWLAGAGLTPAAAAVTVEVLVDRSADSTRLLLTHSDKVTYAIEASKKRVKVLYTQPVMLNPAEVEVGGLIVERLSMRGERTLNIYTGPEYDRYETFELRNPFRVVIDLKRAYRPDGERRPSSSSRKQLEKIIVIDPGHGGVENGAVGPTGVREKDVTLDLARRLKRALERDRKSPRISVVLTRDDDRLLALDERTSIANHNTADLFLSIHLNASRRRQANGAETYYLSTDATDDEARRLAALENQDGAGESNAVRWGEDGRNLDLVLWDLAQNQHLATSAGLAESMQRQLNHLTGTRDRGVRQAPFRVLMGAMMPAILVEAGFISNPAEEAKYKTSAYRDQVVEAMANAVREFLLDLDRISGPGRRSRFGAGSP